jgi:hypothetical protein
MVIARKIIGAKLHELRHPNKHFIASQRQGCAAQLDATTADRSAILTGPRYLDRTMCAFFADVDAMALAAG